jgi:repressor LexA
MLTKKQKRFLDQLTGWVRRRGYFPSVRELAALAGLSSPATVQAYLERLAARGHLRRRNGGWELAGGPAEVPLVGIVPAGPPLEMFEPLGEAVELPEWMADRGGDLVAFRVQGQSMRDAYIQDGDLVLIRRGEQADIGQMVVARLEADDAITLKRLQRGPEGFFLAPENPEFSPIHGPFRLVGRVVGVMRKYR